jgi:hypothetical protein
MAAEPSIGAAASPTYRPDDEAVRAAVASRKVRHRDRILI